MSLLGTIITLGGMVVGGAVGSIVPGVGTAVGISIGAMVGGAIGGYVGNTLFPDTIDLNLPPPPKPYESRVQVSTYGNPIPIVYESGRLAGNIIYMQPVREMVVRSKHRQDGVRYYEYTKTYASTFAIAFCEGPVVGVSRIWVNGEVFADYRDPAGEFYPAGSVALASANLATTIARAEVYFSIYTGTQTQEADAWLSAILGATETPAYRGICYLVFHDFPVGEYRGIPQIEVEIGPQYEAPTEEPIWQVGGTYASGTYYQVYNCRVIVVPTANINQCRFLFYAHATATTYITGASVGLRSGSSEDFDGDPVRITFNDLNNATIPAGESLWSDLIDFAMVTTSNYLVHVYQKKAFSTIYSPRYVATSNEGFYYNITNADETMVQNMTYLSEVSNATEFLKQINGL